MSVTGRVLECWRYPVKSMQGNRCEQIAVGPAGVEGDRAWSVVDADSGKLASAKRFGSLLLAAADDHGITLPDGTRLAFGAARVDDALSSWLGRKVTLERSHPQSQRSYEMTFDPPDDDAELVDIPAPRGTFLDLAPIHLVSRATLRRCAERFPELDWDVRRFRPNLLVELDAAAFAEDGWVGHRLRVGGAELSVMQPTVRCAMPLRAQPGLERQPATYTALTQLNTASPNHLGIYLDVVTPGAVRTGDPVSVTAG